MNVIHGGDGVQEPDWSQTYSDPLDTAKAQEEWRILVIALRDAGTLAPENAGQMERCVDFRIMYAKAKQAVADKGMVLMPKKSSPRSIARINPHWDAMKDAASALDRIEGELGLPPRRRGAVTKVDRKARAKVAADEFRRRGQIGG